LDNFDYVFKAGKKLRKGITTGSCAAAAAKAATYMCFYGNRIDEIEIDTPKGVKLKLSLSNIEISHDYASCSVIKDSGDDPDITDGIEIFASAKKTENAEIIIKGGKGIGVVTKLGLQVEIGMSAINPVPRSMIKNEVSSVIQEGWGVEIEITIPRGEELAKKTYNPKLGIIGGLSILGTTGIIEPMSEDALKDTIALELKCHKVLGKEAVVLVPGNYGEEFSSKRLGVSKADIVKISNYLGFALERCQEYGYKTIILSGHIGKLVKPAGGIFYTHSRVSDTRMEILTAHLALMGMEREQLGEIMNCSTTEEAITIIDKAGYSDIYKLIAEKCAQRCEDYIFGEIQIAVVLFSMKNLLAKSCKTDKLLEEIG